MPRSPLFAKLAAAQAQFTMHDGWELPASFGGAGEKYVEQEYWALKKNAGLLDLSHRSRIIVRGSDAPRFLHGMVTNEVQGLRPGEGNHAFMLDVHGHILADVRILRLDAESYLLDSEPQSFEVILQTLDRHIISDIVELEDAREQLACIAVEGPAVREAIRQALGVEPPEMKILAHSYLQAIAARLVRSSLTGEDGYWLFASPDRTAEFWEGILEQKEMAHQEMVRPVGFEAAEVCRIENGIPRYGVDITDKNLPQETGQMQAISFTKGCYVGQEVVERVRSRGHVNRKLMRLLFDGRQEAPPQTEILFEGQSVGSTGSFAYSFGLGRTVGLGYVRREFAEPGNRVAVGPSSAELASLPVAID